MNNGESVIFGDDGWGESRLITSTFSVQGYTEDELKQLAQTTGGANLDIIPGQNGVFSLNVQGDRDDVDAFISSLFQ